MALPFDVTQLPERRKTRVVFWTDDATAKWLAGLKTEHGLKESLICHRIIKQARDAAQPTEVERRQTERRSA